MTRLSIAVVVIAAFGCGANGDDDVFCEVGTLDIVEFEGSSVERTEFSCDPADAHWMCRFFDGDGVGLVGLGFNCGVAHTIEFRMNVEALSFASIHLTLDANGAVTAAAAVTGALGNASLTRPVESGSLAIEGGVVDVSDPPRSCVRGRLSFVSDGVMVDGSFLSQPCTP
ncbi:MAG TPA: hypothetical protein VML75_25935 [Kofleriaceae bacterium]|nr:hypothetical protein [Kofleriaceae bacterium]